MSESADQGESSVSRRPVAGDGPTAERPRRCAGEQILQSAGDKITKQDVGGEGDDGDGDGGLEHGTILGLEISGPQRGGAAIVSLAIRCPADDGSY